jgi:beta-ribofuranosylaminobenzene 5'-phosphate synthase
MARVTTGGRLHVGFQNLSLAHDRLYGGIGMALAEPRTVVEATPADSLAVDCPDAEPYARRSLDLLDVPGADVSVPERLPRHVGLGSGTQLALATYAAIATAYDRDPAVREAAPTLGRGGRSGVGVATFEGGGFVVDGGHPTDLFTTAQPARGTWTVPPVVARHALPDDWRALLVTPDGERGRSGDGEDRSMREVVDDAAPGIADDVAATVTRRLLPAAATGDLATFGAAVRDVGRRNGAWYADEQGGVYRPPVGTLVDALAESPGVVGAGQSSWGPTTYGLTDTGRADQAREAGERALDAAGVSGDVRVVEFTDEGATVDPDGGSPP